MATSAYIPLFELASGGMGSVTLGVRMNRGFERLYAIKRLRGVAEEDTEIQRMFVDEARLAGLLRHPNVVSVLDVGSDEDGPFLIMEWIDGVPLHRFVRVAAAEGPIPISLACKIMSQVARGLHAAHELRDHSGQQLPLVHRDVSPSNILVGFDGLVRVTDFGIAKALGGQSTTGHGILKGKFGYMSPEQLRFDDIDRRSDLFAFGVVLFEMLSARRLYGTKGGVQEAARRILREPPPGIGEERRDAPPALEELLFELLAKTPDARPSTAREVSDRLDAIERELDDPIALDDYVHDRFDESRKKMSSRIALALSHVQSEEVSTGQVESLLSGELTLPEVKPSQLPKIALVAAAALSMLGLGWWGASLRTPQPETPPVATPAPAPAIGPVEAPPEAAEPAAVTAPEDNEEPIEATPTMRPRRARRGMSSRMRRANPRSAAMSKIVNGFGEPGD
ncbi:MAG: serine/threonine-protein kinase [Myxococcota bacterium]